MDIDIDIYFINDKWEYICIYVNIKDILPKKRDI